jgi:nicotinate-nucleotide adenylyltransferase
MLVGLALARSQYRLPSRNLARGRRIGLLGGSFNPPHAGHRHISLQALKQLRLDEVWWLVTPQNPLKDAAETADLTTRLAAAEGWCRHPKLRATAIETILGTQYTIDTLEALTRLYPETQFIWLMGTDNLRQFHRWRNWLEISRLVPIAILERGGISTLRALASPAGRKLSRYRLPNARLNKLPTISPPVWGLLNLPRHKASSSLLRKNRAIPAR